jgi:rsbT co-antagonist protein RsbR
VAALEQRIAELEHALAAQEQIAAALRQSEALRWKAETQFQRLLESAPDSIVIIDQRGQITLVNQQTEALFGYQRDDLINQPIEILLPPRLRDAHLAHRTRYLGDPHTRPMGSGMDLIGMRKDGTEFSVEISLSPMSIDGDVQIISIIRDITARKRAEAERAQLQDEIIRAQEATLIELSTPLIPVTETTMVMPLIGTIDSRRAQQVMDTLLHGVAKGSARVAILDITGVQIVDTQVAHILVRAAQAVKLLGAQVVVTGIRPEVAQTLIGLGVDLSDMITQSSLLSGMAYAVSHN